MDIFINGKQGAGKTRVADAILNVYRPPYGNRLAPRDVKPIYVMPEGKDKVDTLVHRFGIERPRAIIFDGSISNGADLLIAVQAVKEYRARINADVLAIYVQQAEVTSAKDIAGNMPQLLGTQDVLETPPAGVPAYAAPFDPNIHGCRCPKGYPCSRNCGGRPALDVEDVRKLIVALTKRGKSPAVKGILKHYNAANASEIAVADYTAVFNDLRDLWEEVATTVWPWPVTNTLPIIAKGDRIPVTFDEGSQSYTAATLTDGDRILVEAVNVFAFEGALRLGSGHREPVSMLFELAEVVPVSNLHVAVDKMNTHYFRTGTFEKRAFNAKNCRPATPAEVMEYLNAKLKYENAKN